MWSAVGCAKCVHTHTHARDPSHDKLCIDRSISRKGGPKWKRKCVSLMLTSNKQIYVYLEPKIVIYYFLTDVRRTFVISDFAIRKKTKLLLRWKLHGSERKFHCLEPNPNGENRLRHAMDACLFTALYAKFHKLFFFCFGCERNQPVKLFRNHVVICIIRINYLNWKKKLLYCAAEEGIGGEVLGRIYIYISNADIWETKIVLFTWKYELLF